MFIPETKELEVTKGFTFNRDFQFFSDDAETVPFPLTPYVVTFVVDGVATLASGTGLTINNPQGLVSVRPTPAQTAGAPPAARWRLRIDDGAGDLQPLMKGIFRFLEA